MSPEQPVRLGALEQQVIDILWDNGPQTIREIITQLDNRLAYTTIATVLGNLERKQLVTARRDGRSVRYCARHSRGEHAARLMDQALSASGDRAASMVHFIDTMAPSDLQLLRDYLDRRGDRS